jgi:hypothetical protein
MPAFLSSHQNTRHARATQINTGRNRNITIVETTAAAQPANTPIKANNIKMNRRAVILPPVLGLIIGCWFCVGIIGRLYKWLLGRGYGQVKTQKWLLGRFWRFLIGDDYFIVYVVLGDLIVGVVCKQVVSSDACC